MRSAGASTPEICPVCGADVPPGARSCPECGADHETGWAEDDGSGDVDLPADDDFDYEAFVEREFGSGVRPPGIGRVWWLTAIILLAVFVIGYLIR